MYPYIHITLPSYGVLAFIGGFFTIVFLFFRLEKYSVEFVEFLKLCVVSVIGGAIGSKLLFSITQIPWLIEHFSIQNLILLIPQSGYVYYGGLLGVLGSLFFATRKNEIIRKKVFGIMVPAIPLFHGFGRIGCMMAGCCYGVEVKTPIVIGVLEFNRVPVQLIEAGFEFLLFLVFCLLEKYNSRLYSITNYLLVYAIFRFIIEFYRGDIVRGIWFDSISTAQIISVVVVFLIVIYTIKNRKGCHN